MSLHDQLWMPRPVDIDEPGWEWLFLDGITDEQMDQLEEMARQRGIPRNVLIREIIILGLRALTGDVWPPEQLPPWAV